MKQVHARFRGKPSVFAQFGDSITNSRAFWFGLPYSRKNASQEMEDAFQLVNRHMLKDCWDRKGPQFGNQGSMTIRWAHKNGDKFKDYQGFDVPRLIARDGVHPSNPQKFCNDYSAEGLKHNGFVLRNYLALMEYAEVIRQALGE